MQTINTEKPKLPDNLYHYSGPAGCIGIISNGKFWATQIEYMNDSKEVWHAVELAEKFIKSEQKIPSNIKEETLRELDFITKGVIKTFIVSFSERNDLLSQWRAYCPNGGASIGFCPEKLNKSLEESNDGGSRFELIKCLYTKKDQDEKIEQFFQNYLEKIYASIEGRNTPISEVEIRELVTYGFGRPFSKAAAQMKHESFSEEKEWRLVGQPSQNGNFKWRAGSDMVVPYYEFQFNRNSITSILSGPARQPIEAQRALMSLSHHHLVNVRVDKTETPFRRG